jgi:hypothetical protein
MFGLFGAPYCRGSCGEWWSLDCVEVHDDRAAADFLCSIELRASPRVICSRLFSSEIQNISSHEQPVRQQFRTLACNNRMRTSSLVHQLRQQSWWYRQDLQAHNRREKMDHLVNDREPEHHRLRLQIRQKTSP